MFEFVQIFCFYIAFSENASVQSYLLNARYFGIEHAYAKGKAGARATPTGKKPVAALSTTAAQ